MSDHRLEKIKEEHLADVLRIYNHYVLNSTATFHAHTLAPDEMRELVFFSKPCRMILFPVIGFFPHISHNIDIIFFDLQINLI